MVDVKVLEVKTVLNRSMERCVSRCVNCGKLFEVVRYYENSELVEEKCKEIRGGK